MDQALVEALLLTGLIIFSSFLGLYTINVVNTDTKSVRSMNLYYIKSVITSIILEDYDKLMNSTSISNSPSRCITSEILLSQPLYIVQTEKGVLIKDTYTSKEKDITISNLESVFNDISKDNVNWILSIRLGDNDNSLLTEDLLIDVCLDVTNHKIDLLLYKPEGTG